MNKRTSLSGCSVAATPSAAAAGAELLQRGGNAVDAACAAAWALAVCEPAESGLGGQTTALVRLAGGEVVVVDGHSRGPAGASRRRVTRRGQEKGLTASTVPTTVATLAELQRRYGRLTLREALAPAIALAEDGFAVTPLFRRLVGWGARHWAAGGPEAAVFLPGGKAPEVGSVFRQPQLAKALRRLEVEGALDFYRGGIAREIVADMESRGGLVTAEDLSGVPGAAPVVRRPIAVSYRGRTVLAPPPPSGGVQVLLALRLLDRLLSGGEDEGAWRVALARATLAAFRERERWPDHPEDLDPSLLAWMTSPERAEAVAGRMDTAAAPVDWLGESGNTTHLCAADSEGSVVSLTQSVQSVFGAKAVHPTLGFVYNNYLSACPRGRHPYGLGPRCLPQSNASPTLVLTPSGEPELALGSAGSRRITTSVVQVLSAVLDRGVGLAEAVAMPRAHALVSGRLWVERSVGAEASAALAARFADRRRKGRRSYQLGAVQALAWTGAGGVQGAADPRRDGAAAYARPDKLC
jgi:gamma-glutamyltranspeptidase/glutathione hydrolase